MPGRPALGAAFLVLLVAGCSGSSRPHTSSASTSAAPQTTTTTGLVTSSTTVPVATTASPATTSQSTDGQSFQQFQSPSGNIGCYIDESGARCDIRTRTWQPHPRPRTCDLDYGQGMFVGADHADFVCAGDTTLGQGAVLPYGSSVHHGVFVCESAPDGVTCHESRHGHGFFISRESYLLF